MGLLICKPMSLRDMGHPMAAAFYVALATIAKMLQLSTPVQLIKGVGPRNAEALKKRR